MTVGIHTIDGLRPADVIVVATRAHTAVAGASSGNPGPYTVTEKYAILDLGTRESHQLRYIEVKDGQAHHANYWIDVAQWNSIVAAGDFGDLFAARAMIINRAKGIA